MSETEQEFDHYEVAAMRAKSMVHFCNEKRRTQGLDPFEEEGVK